MRGACMRATRPNNLSRQKKKRLSLVFHAFFSIRFSIFQENSSNVVGLIKEKFNRETLYEQSVGAMLKKKRGGEASATFEILSTRGTAYEPSARVVAVQSIVNGFTKVKRSALKSGESFFRLVEDMTCEFICEKSTKSYFIHYVLVRLLRSRSSND